MPDPVPASAAAQPEAALIARVARGDRTAFAMLFERAAPKVKGYLLRLGCTPAAAEELTQDVMVTVWRRAAQYDPARAGPMTWLFVIARNRRIDSLRREKAATLYGGDQTEIDPSPTPDAGAIAADREARVAAALADLPADQREVIRRAFFEEEPHVAIATALGLPLGTVKSRIRLAFAKLRARLEELS
ncbi:MAG: sigma-70 family RNA polymerase sigma factor [Hyphomonadaceae bacterium]